MSFSIIINHYTLFIQLLYYSGLVVASVVSFLALVNLSIDDSPKQPNANNATALTRSDDGAVSTVEKLLWYIVIHKNIAHIIPTNLFDDGDPVSSFSNPVSQLIIFFMIILLINIICF